MHVFLPIVLFCSWLALVIKPTGKLAIEDIKAGVQDDERRGVKVIPGFPLYPLLFWFLAYSFDKYVGPWGSISILVFHLVAFMWAMRTIVQDHYTLKRMEAEQKPLSVEE